MFEKCQNCGSRVISGRRDELGVFCSAECRNFVAHPGFCQTCLSTSSPRSTGGTFTFNGIGTGLYGRKDPCSVCGSVVQTHWICIFFVPIIPLGKYRVKYTQPRRFLSRRLSDKVLPPFPSATADLAVLRDGLRSPHSEMREHCASILGDRGLAAFAALPELELLLRDPNRRVRTRAKWAVETIQRKTSGG